MSFKNIIAGLTEKGQEAAHNERYRMRAAFIASRAAVKHSPWLENDDKAFDAIDAVVLNLMSDAGMSAPQAPAQGYSPPPPPPPPLSIDQMIAKVRGAGFSVVSQAAGAPAAQPETLEQAIRNTTRPKAPFGGEAPRAFDEKN